MTTDPKDWARELVARVAKTVKALRDEQGLTAAELSDRTAIGKPISRAVISDLETGRKQTLDISELLTLAAALGVPPASLLFPDDASAEVLPGKSMPGLEGYGWFIGAKGNAPDGVATDESMLIPLRLFGITEKIDERQSMLYQLGREPDVEVLNDETAAIERALEYFQKDYGLLLDYWQRKSGEQQENA
ncbi:helix-turn-helix domain-containing protein [Mycobacterium sp. NPDC050853]|uniref:helix-turn-helix domain-containing protein n=1 Tax=Mycobacterium sp. NPDC050853 TaxID=3155160 RepID=UPI00340C57EB